MCPPMVSLSGASCVVCGYSGCTHLLFSDGLRLIHLYIKRHHNSIRLDILEQSRCYLLKNKGRLKTDNAAFSDGLFLWRLIIRLRPLQNSFSPDSRNLNIDFRLFLFQISTDSTQIPPLIPLGYLINQASGRLLGGNRRT